MKLMRYFEKNIIKQDEEKIVCSFKNYSTILSDFNIKIDDSNPAANNDGKINDAIICSDGD